MKRGKRQIQIRDKILPALIPLGGALLVFLFFLLLFYIPLGQVIDFAFWTTPQTEDSSIWNVWRGFVFCY